MAQKLDKSDAARIAAEERYKHVQNEVARRYLVDNPPESIFDTEERPTVFKTVQLDYYTILEIDESMPQLTNKQKLLLTEYGRYSEDIL